VAHSIVLYLVERTVAAKDGHTGIYLSLLPVVYVQPAASFLYLTW